MNGNLLTVKEYAAKEGLTEQAVYKKIRAGKLETIDIQENGKPKKYVFFQNKQPEKEPAAEEKPQKEPAAEISRSGPGDPAAAALEKAIAALTAQLEEKDRQINRLTELLNQSQQLQAHSQTLIEHGSKKEEPIQENDQEITKDPEATLPPTEERKKSFWSWLFGRET